MPETNLILQDLEGDLLKINSGNTVHYGKRLSLEVAWHSDNPKDLSHWFKDLVSKVEKDWSKKLLFIHYRPNLVPLSPSQLEEFLQPQKPLFNWRLARMATELCQALKRLHKEDFPQGVIHPYRVGVLEGRFLLFPTLTGIISPYSISLTAQAHSWLPFIAPEILRTRAKTPALLRAGDIYSLGKMLQTIMLPGETHPLPEDPLKAAEKIVEHQITSTSMEYPPNRKKIGEALDKMINPDPAARPSLHELLETFHRLKREFAPEVVIQNHIKEHDLKNAQEKLQTLDKTRKNYIFDIPPSTYHILQADLALAHTPPDYTQAIDHLKRAKNREPENPTIHHRIGITYQKYTNHTQHQLLADQAYQKAAVLSKWQEDIIKDWVSILEQTTADRLLSRTSIIPWDKRPPIVFIQRAVSHMETSNYYGSWHECVDYFFQFGFNQDVYKIARQAAAHIPASELLLWMKERQNINNIPAIQAIVWEYNDQPEKAAFYYNQAQRSTSKED
jgi:tetratricopeptide (TPR) repeat protein